MNHQMIDETSTTIPQPGASYPLWAKLLHAGMAVFGITAYLTAEFAEHASASSIGYLVHAYLGLSLLAFILVRFLVGVVPVGMLSFKGWFPVSRDQIRYAMEDIAGLFRLEMPSRSSHEGISGIVQSAGLLIFLWMGMTGAGLFYLGEDGMLYDVLEELHEVGEGLVPAFLLLHIGAVVLHSLIGHEVWQQMWKFGK